MQKQDTHCRLVLRSSLRCMGIVRNKRTVYWAGTRKMPVSIVIFLILVAAVAVFYAPGFLFRADTPVRADAIILFMGKDSSPRIREAGQLLREGYAPVLIIPAHQRVLTPRDFPPETGEVNNEPDPSFGAGYPRHYELTHVEVLTAKRMMDSMGLGSAIMVSSPYHMQRIAMISEKVFGNGDRQLAYVPTRYEPALGSFADVPPADLPMVVLEFVKMAWFRIYMLWQ